MRHPLFPALAGRRIEAKDGVGVKQVKTLGFAYNSFNRDPKEIAGIRGTSGSMVTAISDGERACGALPAGNRRHLNTWTDPVRAISSGSRLND
jgi:hypothetical protein